MTASRTLDRLNEMTHSKDELVEAFPAFMRNDALAAISLLSENQFSSRWKSFALRVGNKLVSIPFRIYFDPPLLQNLRLNKIQSELLDCLLTRHHDGFVRQKHLARIIHSQNIWIPCFVVPLVGEYVIEILRLIHENLANLRTPLYAEFIAENPDFIALTGQRVMSYWDCYYRSTKREDYPGFAVLELLKAISRDRQLREIRHFEVGGAPKADN
jgi:hypothetical protein